MSFTKNSQLILPLKMQEKIAGIVKNEK